jgi:hypothetical protein
VATRHYIATSKKRKPAHDPLLQASRDYVASEPHKNNQQVLFEPAVTSQGLYEAEDLMAEVATARLLNIEMTSNPVDFIVALETRIADITQTQKNCILILDEVSGTYWCLNDDKDASLYTQKRELTWISDRYLQNAMGTDNTLHAFLHYQGAVYGIIAIANKLDGSHFTAADQRHLEHLARYLSVQVNHYLILKASLLLPGVQKTLLGISNRLLAAIDSTSIFEVALKLFVKSSPLLPVNILF